MDKVCGGRAVLVVFVVREGREPVHRRLSCVVSFVSFVSFVSHERNDVCC